jgi:ATP-dependent DNA helicase RecQ
MKLMGMNDVVTVLGDFVRRNIKLELHTKTGQHPRQFGKTTADLIIERFRKQQGIIFCATRDHCGKIKDGMVSKFIESGIGIAADIYHAECSPEDKRRVMEGFMSGAIQVLIATSAFGLGVDKAGKC